ncbi:MAG: transposase [Campylobacter sp.]|nr:transposase [Campylobacter sp.]
MKTDLRLSDRTYICKECGNEMHRDINASINAD